jgi:hypothetical protein
MRTLTGIQQIFNEKGEVDYLIVAERKRYKQLTHPNSGADGNIDEHRLIASDALGKGLPKGCVVHHFYDGLVICQDTKYHELLHTRQKAKEICGDPNKRRCTFCHEYDEVANLKYSTTYYHLTCRRKYSRNWIRKHYNKTGTFRGAYKGEE